MVTVTTERMLLFPIDREQLRAKVENEPDAEMRQAYSEMLDGCIMNPERHLWYTVWMMRLRSRDGAFVGDLCFKGLDETGTVEIGYGVRPEYAGRGFATEAVVAMAKWARAQPGVLRVEAETEPDNLASQRVLQKAGFEQNGVIGKEGPRFEWRN